MVSTGCYALDVLMLAVLDELRCTGITDGRTDRQKGFQLYIDTGCRLEMTVILCSIRVFQQGSIITTTCIRKIL